MTNSFKYLQANCFENSIKHFRIASLFFIDIIMIVWLSSVFSICECFFWYWKDRTAGHLVFWKPWPVTGQIATANYKTLSHIVIFTLSVHLKPHFPYILFLPCTSWTKVEIKQQNLECNGWVWPMYKSAGHGSPLWVMRAINRRVMWAWKNVFKNCMWITWP